MIVVDTSVWISAHRKPVGQLAIRLRQLLDADEVALALPVRLELTAGVARRDRPALTRALAALPVLQPTDETWTLIERWIVTAAAKGHRFDLSDLLIAGLTHEIGGLVWSEDDDFETLETLNFVQRYEF